MTNPTVPTSPALTPAADQLHPLRSVHTTSFPLLLKHLNASVLVSTYQAGKLVILRADGDVLNTNFRGFSKPMGLAAQGARLAIGTALEIWEYHDAPAVARRLPPEEKHDACFLPRWSVTTGDVQMHEMAFDDTGELWFVNTRFSCLCTRDTANTFVPRWRPPFITELAPEDRCHLNGMALRDGSPRYVTALGITDTPGGWRANKRDGGLLLDVTTDEVLLRELSMPHSPRWHDGRLWLLESGTGSIGFIDPATACYRSIAEVPGFTRGLDFAGRYAFIGLSQVRESAIFSGLPLTDRLTERTSGVWALDIETGETVAFIKFEDHVQEIFAVQLLPGRRYPDVVNDQPTLLADSFVLPGLALDMVSPQLRFHSPAPEPD